MKIKTILVATDLSETSKPAVRYAADLANENGAKLVLLHTLDPGLYKSHDLYIRAWERAELFKHHRDRAMDSLRAILPEDEYPEMEIERRVVHKMPAAESIVDAAERVEADMIVIGTHGRSGVSRLLHGSVAEEVLRTANCPVTTIRPCGGVEGRRNEAEKAG